MKTHSIGSQLYRRCVLSLRGGVGTFRESLRLPYLHWNDKVKKRILAEKSTTNRRKLEKRNFQRHLSAHIFLLLIPLSYYVFHIIHGTFVGAQISPTLAKSMIRAAFSPFDKH